MCERKGGLSVEKSKHLVCCSVCSSGYFIFYFTSGKCGNDENGDDDDDDEDVEVGRESRVWGP